MSRIESALKNYYDHSAAKITKEQYLLLMEQLGQEPNPDEMPVAFEDFPFQIQQIINIFSILPDVWEGFSGTYLGKDYSVLPYLMDEIFEVEDKHLTMKFLLHIGSIIMEQRSREQKERERKAKQKKGK